MLLRRFAFLHHKRDNPTRRIASATHRKGDLSPLTPKHLTDCACQCAPLDCPSHLWYIQAAEDLQVWHLAELCVLFPLQPGRAPCGAPLARDESLPDCQLHDGREGTTNPTVFEAWARQGCRMSLNGDVSAGVHCVLFTQESVDRLEDAFHSWRDRHDTQV